jgi:hypothetical protein
MELRDLGMAEDKVLLWQDYRRVTEMTGPGNWRSPEESLTVEHHQEQLKELLALAAGCWVTGSQSPEL